MQGKGDRALKEGGRDRMRETTGNEGERKLEEYRRIRSRKGSCWRLTLRSEGNDISAEEPGALVTFTHCNHFLEKHSTIFSFKIISIISTENNLVCLCWKRAFTLLLKDSSNISTLTETCCGPIMCNMKPMLCIA